MSNSATSAGVTPAPKGLLARFIGIIVAPKDTFASVVPAPKWLGMLAATTVLAAFFTALPLTTEAGRQAALDQQVQQMQSFGMNVTDEVYAELQKGAGRMPYTTGGLILVFSPIMALIFTALLFVVFNVALGGEASFKQVFAIFVHAGVISTMSAVFSGLVNYFRNGSGSVANVGALLPMLSEKSFLAGFLGAIDVFFIWYFIVLAMGLAVLYRRRTQPIAISLLAVYAVIAVVIAVFKSRAGGA